MKLLIFKSLMPFAAIALAATGAVTTQKTHEKETQTLEKLIHFPLASSCEPVNVNCVETGSITCMTTDATPRIVYRWNATRTACPNQLFRP